MAKKGGILRPHVDLMTTQLEVTGSGNLVRVCLPDDQVFKFVVDCGLFQEKEYDEYNYTLPFNSEEVSFALVTHNHVDHIGRLPFMTRKGFTGNIYATKKTQELMPLSLNNSYKVLKEIAQKKGVPQLYDEDDTHMVKRLLKGVDYKVTFSAREHVRVTFLRSGHLLGAAMVLVQIMYPKFDPINLLFTGDFNDKNLFFDVPKIPKWVLELPLTVIMESTYGDTNSSSIKEVFKENILNHLKNNGTIVIPVFALGRAQTICYELKSMQDSGELDKNIPIIMDGKLAVQYTKLCLKDTTEIKPSMRSFLPENFMYVEDEETRHGVLEDRNRKIIITTSGMGTYGPAQLYIPEYLARENSLIHFVGFNANGTVGRKLQNAEMGEIVEICGEKVIKKADVKYTSEFSSHARADEEIEFLRQFHNLKCVLVNHGKTDVKELFAERVKEQLHVKDVMTFSREDAFRLNQYGLEKSYSSKW